MSDSFSITTASLNYHKLIDLERVETELWVFEVVKWEEMTKIEIVSLWWCFKGALWKGARK